MKELQETNVCLGEIVEELSAWRCRQGVGARSRRIV